MPDFPIPGGDCAHVHSLDFKAATGEYTLIHCLKMVYEDDVYLKEVFLF